jgi:glycosyltransferase involved in cell wall biosynthesis
MKLLVLAEGDAERWESWSGSTKSLVDHLREGGHEVVTADVDLYGRARWLGAARTFSPNRKRWGVKYHLAGSAYRVRSRRAARAIAAQPAGLDCVLQIGATFEPIARGTVPYAVFCDSNIRMAQEGIAHGVSDAAWLRPAELEAIREREARVYRDACLVFTISEYLRRSFVEDFGLGADRVCTVGAGPNLDVSRIPALRAAPRDGAPTVLFVGRQFERKGGSVLLEAFRTVRARVPGARLVIVGPPTRPPLEPGVEWLGSLDKNRPEEWARLVAAYQDADVFCLPSLFEPFGIVLLEAMLFGLPCVGTADWAIPEMIADGVTGHTVPRGSTAALADRLGRLLADRASAHRMGLAGRRRAEERFSWSTVAARMASRLQPCLRRS